MHKREREWRRKPGFRWTDADDHAAGCSVSSSGVIANATARESCAKQLLIEISSTPPGRADGPNRGLSGAKP